MSTVGGLGHGRDSLWGWMGHWWLPWTSNPVAGSDPACGGFDSHAPSPFRFRDLRGYILSPAFSISGQYPSASQVRRSPPRVGDATMAFHLKFHGR